MNFVEETMKNSVVYLKLDIGDKLLGWSRFDWFAWENVLIVEL